MLKKYYLPSIKLVSMVEPLDKFSLAKFLDSFFGSIMYCCFIILGLMVVVGKGSGGFL